jgi:hypothetical protein
VIGNAVKVMRIATGEEQEELPEAGKDYARKGGLRGGKARAKRRGSPCCPQFPA